MNYKLLAIALTISCVGQAVNDAPKKIYFAGALFSAQEILGNEIIAEAVNTLSKGRYLCILPQQTATVQTDERAIRDEDLHKVLSAEAALFNFNGTELDSGTVVEYMLAKFADIPSVIIRTDFRALAPKACHLWAYNPMAKFFPRTETLLIDAFDMHVKNKFNSTKTANEIAQQIVTALDKVTAQKPLLEGKEKENIMQWIDTIIKS